MDLLLSFLLKLPRIYNNFLEFNCLQFLVLFKSVFFRKLSVAEGDFRRVETLAFFPLSVKKQSKTNSKTMKKKRIIQSLLSCKTIIYVKSPVLSFNQLGNQSVKQTIN